MNEVSASKAFAQPPPETFPYCMHCSKPVESLVIARHPRDANKLTVSYQCHGEHASQDIPASLVEGERGLAAYTVFNDFTSGLMPRR